MVLVNTHYMYEISYEYETDDDIEDCVIGVISVLVVPGSYYKEADSDMDYNGWNEIDFNLLNKDLTKHRLDGKLDRNERWKIESLILKFHEENW